MAMQRFRIRCTRKHIVLVAIVCLALTGLVMKTHLVQRVHCVGVLGDRYISYVKETKIVFPTETELMGYDYNTLGCLYEMYTRTLQYHCRRARRFGEIPRRGWYLCLDFLKTSPINCTIVSANPAFDERSFVKHIQKYCNANYKILNNIDFGKTTLIEEIDVVTFSVTKVGDFDKLKKTLDTYDNNVRQLLLEIRPWDKSPSEVRNLLSSLEDLSRRDFKLVWFDIPYSCVPFFNNRESSCISLSYVRVNSKLGQFLVKTDTRSLVLPSPEIWVEFSRIEAVRSLYHEYLSTVQFHCKHVVRMGKVSDGGWDVCHDYMFMPSPTSPCIIYSFGIQNDFSFDNDISNTYGCYVFSFDPSMGVSDHRHSEKVYFYNKGLYNKETVVKRKNTYWHMDSLDGIRKQLNHVQTPIKILKMDIEHSEWISLKQIIDTGQLRDVEQLLIEFHGNGDKAKLMILKRLYDIGFRIFWHHKNPYAAFYDDQIARSRANEISFINVDFLRQQGTL